ncbi:unnamed protein product [Staurois parvus]|uniref:Uncharacterized protein n=1 Tax=Staurois parvus TaxID=386267 RepID=A0ABN9EA66_9NEOB|nr:unnamed protein product [Staurois parvus]
MRPPGNRGSWGPCVLAQTQKSLTKKMAWSGKGINPMEGKWLNTYNVGVKLLH